MAKSRNPFAKYTLSIATQYQETHDNTIEAMKKPPRKKHTSMDSLLRECVFLGATRFGNNYIA